MSDSDPNAWNRMWSRELCDQVGELYKSFLYLHLKYPDQRLVPTKEIDEFWHFHILFTKKYQRDCEQIFGRYLHHSPANDPEVALESSEKLEEYHVKTLKLVAKEFPELVSL